MEYKDHKENVLRSVSVNNADAEDFHESLQSMLQHHTIKEISRWKVGDEEVYTQDFLLHACLSHRINTSTTSIALCLIRAGIDVNLENLHGNTPMALAIKRGGDISVINEMVAHGANVHNLVLDLSYFDMALELRRYDVCTLLLNAGFNINAPNTFGVPYGRNLLDSIEDISEALVDSNALFYAVYKHDPEVVQFVLNSGANPNETAIRMYDPACPYVTARPHRDDFYMWSLIARTCTVTPLYLSVLLQKTETTRLLLDAGADPNFISNSGESLFGLLDLNIKTKFRPSVDVSAFSLLFDYGLQMSVIRKTYKNALENYYNRGGDLVFEAHEDTYDAHNISKLIQKKINEERRLALTMALHTRLGANAPLRELGVDMIRDIAFMNSN